MSVVNNLHAWHPEEIRYLEKLSRTCQELSNRYKALYTAYKSKQVKYKLPTIILGSVLGLASFGSAQFGEGNQNKIAIFVGATNIVISIISSVEAFLKLGENMSGSLVASTSYQKLKEKIDVELSIPEDGRTGSGLMFLRECYSEYQKIGDLAPAVLVRNRYITEETSKLHPYDGTSHAPPSPAPMDEDVGGYVPVLPVFSRKDKRIEPTVEIDATDVEVGLLGGRRSKVVDIPNPRQ